MAATPEFRSRGPQSVEPPPPDLFGAAAAGATVARPTEPTTCCGRYLHYVPVIAVLICVIIAAGVNFAVSIGEPIPFVSTLPPMSMPNFTDAPPPPVPTPRTTQATPVTTTNTTRP